MLNALTPLCLACTAGLEPRASRHCHRWWSPSPSVWPWSIWCFLPVGEFVECLQLKQGHHQMYMSKALTHCSPPPRISTVPCREGHYLSAVANVVRVLCGAISSQILHLHLGHSSLHYELALITTQLQNQMVQFCLPDGIVYTLVLSEWGFANWIRWILHKMRVYGLLHCSIAMTETKYK